MFKKLLPLLISAVFAQSSFALPTPNTNNTVDIQAAFEFSSLDPSRAGFVFTRMQILETLLNVDEKGNLIPGLAEAWQISDDGKQWQLELRENVHFHDQTPLLADIVVADLKRAQNKPGALQDSGIIDIKALSPQRIQITLAQPYRPLGAALAHYSSAILAPASFDANGQVTQLIGTGPFSVAEIAVPHKLLVQRFDEYWGKPAQIDYASYLTGHRAEARVLQARSGQADIVYGLDPASVPMLKRLPNLTIYRSDLPRTLALKLNAADPALNSVEVRKALSLAINRKGIATAILRVPEAATDQLLPAYMADWHLDQPIASQDLAQAQQILKNAGWSRSDDGWLVRDGKRFELNLITYADRPELTSVATAIQDQWRKLGVKLNVNVTNSSAIPAGHADGSLQVALIARNYGVIADPLGVLMTDFGPSKGGDWGSMNWHSDTQQILNNLSHETDPTRYHRLAQQVATALYQERPLIPVASYVQQTAVNKRLKGFRFDPYERSYYLNELEWQ